MQANVQYYEHKLYMLRQLRIQRLTCVSELKIIKIQIILVSQVTTDWHTLQFVLGVCNEIKGLPLNSVINSIKISKKGTRAIVQKWLGCLPCTWPMRLQSLKFHMISWALGRAISECWARNHSCVSPNMAKNLNKQ